MFVCVEIALNAIVGILTKKNIHKEGVRCRGFNQEQNLRKLVRRQLYFLSQLVSKHCGIHKKKS